MNEEQVNALLQIYQNRLNAMTAQNVALEATVQVLNNKIQALQQPQEPQGFEAASVPEPTPITKPRTSRKK